MIADDGRYEIAWRVGVRAPLAQVVPWLVEPARMMQWMAGIDEITPVGTPLTSAGTQAVGAKLRVRTGHGAYAGWSFLGELVVSEPGRLVRRYELEQMRAGAGPVEVQPAEYIRTVTYVLPPGFGGGTDIRCEILTIIPGLRKRAARAGAKAEQKSLTRSLERLGELVDGSEPRRALFGRRSVSARTASPL